MTHYLKTLDTSAGPLFLAATDKAVTALVWSREALARIGIVAAERGAPDILAAAAAQVEEYLAGMREAFDLPLDLAGTPFQRKVWDALRTIPFGETWSYGDLAKRVGNPGAVRAVGTANGRNPVCIMVPCHRVVRATGDLGGYAGGVDRKAFLLGLESARRAAARPALFNALRG